MDRATAPSRVPVEALPANKPVKRQYRSYADRIRDLVPTQDPRHIEAFMRLEHSTLDGLSEEQFSEEVLFSAECVRTAGLNQAERNARSMGL